jgi:hypothetical protein
MGFCQKDNNHDICLLGNGSIIVNNIAVFFYFWEYVKRLFHFHCSVRINMNNGVVLIWWDVVSAWKFMLVAI